MEARLIPARAGNTPVDIAPACAAAAHPRSRGEHSGAQLTPQALFGSSPLARGTLIPVWNGIKDIRLIPARAGNTYSGLEWN